MMLSPNQEIILIVDDSPDNLRVLSTTLTEYGYEVRCVKSASMALIAVQAAPPDLILLDIQMPGMNGYELCQKFKSNQQTSNIPIIFLSALDEPMDKIKGFAVGGVDYISKPFQVEEVLARIKNQLTIKNLQKQLREQNLQLLQAKDAAEAGNRIKSEFLAKMSHELRTPLTAILGYSELLVNELLLHSEQREYIKIIRNSAQQLLEMINDVLDMSKIEAGKITFTKTKFDLNLLLNSVKDLFSIKALSKNLTFEIKKDLEVPQYVETDEGKLRQVLINLISNALKFTNSGGVTIKIKSLKYEQEFENYLQPVNLLFQIEDTGAGISLEEMTQLFQPFVQTETGRKSHQGTGLGLAISQKFVSMMGGEIKIDSEVGKGTTVRFNIIADIASGDQIEEKKISQTVIGLASKPIYRILVTEDNWANRKLLVKILEKVGFEVKEAANGSEAMKIWEDWQPHLIWMDMQMPLMNGFEATKKIKSTQRGKKTVIIALTASGLAQEGNLIMDVGCDDFIYKPFSEENIWEKIVKHLNVKFIYASSQEELKTEQPETTLITQNDIAALSLDWLDNFRQATLELNLSLMQNLIEGIRDQNPLLAEQLNCLAKNFQYEKILSLIEI